MSLAAPSLRPVRVCRHCGTDVEGEGDFCCQGCRTVHDLLQGSGLGRFYQLKDEGYCFQPGRPVDWVPESFAFLDGPELRPRYVNGQGEARFFVEGIHCVACLWLLERLPQLLPGLSACRLDLSQSLLTVRLEEGASLGAAAALVQRLGYRPHAIPLDEDGEAYQKAERRRTLLRLGVAGACAGNLMLLAIPLYGGAQGTLAELFRWVSLALYLPVGIYSAAPFYRSALGALRARMVNIDVPIALALLLGPLVSAANLLRGSQHIYFDSLAALVFLLLASRYALKELQARAARTSQLAQHFVAPVARKVEGEGTVDVPSDKLKAGDRVRVAHGERIPGDGRVLEGRSQLNVAWLTGEAMPRGAGPGDEVLAGSRNEGPELVIAIERPLESSRLGGILRQLQDAPRSLLIGLTDKVSRVFLWVVLGLAAAVLLAFLPTRPGEGLDRALSLLIVTCPCALALATPLSYGHALGRAYAQGWIIKSGEALERLAGIRTVLFDKTGTLTSGELEVEEIRHVRGDGKRNRALILGLESHSQHPVARALRRHLAGLGPVEIAELEEQAGQGIRGRFEGRAVELRALSDRDSTRTLVGLWEEGRLLARIALGDRPRPEAEEAVARLRDLGCTVGLLSGDGEAVARNLGREVGIAPNRALGGLSPERKLGIIAATPGALMVGDGANDAPALQAAQVGVAMHGGMELSLKAADVYLSHPDLRAVPDLVLLGRETRKVLRRNFALSIAYNAVGGGAALLGLINPFLAAVLMPLSSVTVLLSSGLSTRAVRARFGGGK